MRPRLPIRAVVAHPNVAGRLALRLLLDNEPDLELVGDAPDAPRGRRLAHDRGAAFLIVHESLLARGQAGVWPLPLATALVVLGMEADPGATTAALRDGAAAYVRWDRASDDLPPALRALAAATAAAAAQADADAGS